MDLLQLQYQLISERRSALLDYCESISPKHFTANLPSFADKSICTLLIHVVNVYEFWIGHFAGIKDRKSVV